MFSLVPQKRTRDEEDERHQQLDGGRGEHLVGPLSLSFRSSLLPSNTCPATLSGRGRGRECHVRSDLCDYRLTCCLESSANGAPDECGSRSRDRSNSRSIKSLRSSKSHCYRFCSCCVMIRNRRCLWRCSVSFRRFTCWQLPDICCRLEARQLKLVIQSDLTSLSHLSISPGYGSLNITSSGETDKPEPPAGSNLECSNKIPDDFLIFYR